MARINIFQNIDIFHSANFVVRQSSYLRIHGIYIPGSISFNNVAVLISRSSNGSKTLSLSFGLYSLNGSTLSLANSASFNQTATTTAVSWQTLITSATQDITPGNWYFAFLSKSVGTGNFLQYGGVVGKAIGIGAHGGAAVRGILTVTDTVLPTSIATSNMQVEGGSNETNIYPYILISA